MNNKSKIPFLCVAYIWCIFFLHWDVVDGGAKCWSCRRLNYLLMEEWKSIESYNIPFKRYSNELLVLIHTALIPPSHQLPRPQKYDFRFKTQIVIADENEHLFKYTNKLSRVVEKLSLSAFSLKNFTAFSIWFPFAVLLAMFPSFDYWIFTLIFEFPCYLFFANYFVELYKIERNEREKRMDDYGGYKISTNLFT